MEFVRIDNAKARKHLAAMLKACQGLALDQAMDLMRNREGQWRLISEACGEEEYEDMNRGFEMIYVYEPFEKQFLAQGAPQTRKDFIPGREYPKEPVGTWEMLRFLRLGEIASIVEIPDEMKPYEERWMGKEVKIDKYRLRLVSNVWIENFGYPRFEIDELRSKLKWAIRPAEAEKEEGETR